MRRKWKVGLLVAVLTVFMMSMTAVAADKTVKIFYSYIVGDQVVVISVGNAASDDGNYYLFDLKTYEAGIGTRTNYCATAPANSVAQFVFPLYADTPLSKLTSRFVVAVLRGGAYVQVSSEMYITNPEAAAKASTVSFAEATGNKKGVFMDWRFSNQITGLGAGYVIGELDAYYFFKEGGFTYTYNGKPYEFSLKEVAATDLKVSQTSAQGADFVAILTNSYKGHPGTAEMVYPAALTGVAKGTATPNKYAFNVSNQIGEEKLEAWVAFLADRYGKGAAQIQHFIIGNEVNSSYAWHYAGDISAEAFTSEYAKQFRVCYNAIKSRNAGAKVYVCVDQCWTHTDTGHPKSSYGGKTFIDIFNREITSAGNINWGFSFHPYAVPLDHAKFWTTRAGYGGLVKHTENTKMITPVNMEVATNYLSKAQFRAPADSVSLAPGGKRDVIISELGFNSSALKGMATDENTQAAAMVYAFKLAQANPDIKAVMISTLIDNPGEITQGLANGLMRVDGGVKPAYAAFQSMDKGNTDYLLPFIGKSSWAEAVNWAKTYNQ